MIIYGTRGVTYSYDEGNFHCPVCRSSQPYKHKRVRRFFTLYFIPIIPLDLLGEYVECHDCQGTYNLEVLDWEADDNDMDEEEFEAEFHRAIKRVMVLMMLADGVVDDEEVRVIQKIFGQLTSRKMSVSEVQAEIDRVENAGHDVESALAGCASGLNANGKAMVIKAAYLVAAADGEFHEDEKAMIRSIGRTLEMSSAEVKSAINSLKSE